MKQLYYMKAVGVRSTDNFLLSFVYPILKLCFLDCAPHDTAVVSAVQYCVGYAYKISILLLELLAPTGQQRQRKFIATVEIMKFCLSKVHNTTLAINLTEY